MDSNSEKPYTLWLNIANKVPIPGDVTGEGWSVESHVETVVNEGGIGALVPFLELDPVTLSRPWEQWSGWR